MDINQLRNFFVSNNQLQNFLVFFICYSVAKEESRSVVFQSGRLHLPGEERAAAAPTAAVPGAGRAAGCDKKSAEVARRVRQGRCEDSWRRPARPGLSREPPRRAGRRRGRALWRWRRRWLRKAGAVPACFPRLRSASYRKDRVRGRGRAELRAATRYSVGGRRLRSCISSRPFQYLKLLSRCCISSGRSTKAGEKDGDVTPSPPPGSSSGRGAGDGGCLRARTSGRREGPGAPEADSLLSAPRPLGDHTGLPAPGGTQEGAHLLWSGRSAEAGGGSPPVAVTLAALPRPPPGPHPCARGRRPAGGARCGRPPGEPKPAHRL